MNASNAHGSSEQLPPDSTTKSAQESNEKKAFNNSFPVVKTPAKTTFPVSPTPDQEIKDYKGQVEDPKINVEGKKAEIPLNPPEILIQTPSNFEKKSNVKRISFPSSPEPKESNSQFPKAATPDEGTLDGTFAASSEALNSTINLQQDKHETFEGEDDKTAVVNSTASFMSANATMPIHKTDSGFASTNLEENHNVTSTSFESANQTMNMEVNRDDTPKANTTVDGSCLNATTYGQNDIHMDVTTPIDELNGITGNKVDFGISGELEVDQVSTTTEEELKQEESLRQSEEFTKYAELIKQSQAPTNEEESEEQAGDLTKQSDELKKPEELLKQSEELQEDVEGLKKQPEEFKTQEEPPNERQEQSVEPPTQPEELKSQDGPPKEPQEQSNEPPQQSEEFQQQEEHKEQSDEPPKKPSEEPEKQNFNETMNMDVDMNMDEVVAKQAKLNPMEDVEMNEPAAFQRFNSQIDFLSDKEKQNAANEKEKEGVSDFHVNDFERACQKEVPDDDEFTGTPGGEFLFCFYFLLLLFFKFGIVNYN